MQKVLTLFETYCLPLLTYGLNCNVKTSHSTQRSMLPNDNVSMSVGHLDHVLLTVYSLIEHVTWKSPGPMCD